MCTLCSWRTRARPGCQLCPAQGSLCGLLKASGDGDHVSWCSLPAHTHTCLPPTLLLTHKHIHPHSSLGENTLTHIHSDCVLTPRGTHTHSKGSLSAQRVQRDNKTLPYANWTEPESEKGGWQTGEKDPRRQRALYRVWEPRPGASLLGPLAPSWLPKVHCGQGMT